MTTLEKTELGKLIEKEQKKHIKSMICNCCGASCKGRQWWNRDTGYSICNPCARRQSRGAGGVAEVEELNGVWGVNFYFVDSILDAYDEVTDERYEEMLCVLPPLRTTEHFDYLADACGLYPTVLEAVECFQVGEASGSKDGLPTFDTFAIVKDRTGTLRYLNLGVLPRMDKVVNAWNY